MRKMFHFLFKSDMIVFTAMTLGAMRAALYNSNEKVQWKGAISNTNWILIRWKENPKSNVSVKELIKLVECSHLGK